MARNVKVALLAAIILAAAQPAAAGFDGTLNQAGPTCIERFYAVAQQAYPAGSPCPEVIQQALSATQQEMCPEGGVLLGSPLQACMNATKAAIDAWTSFVTDCPVLKIAERHLGDEPEVTDGFSCLPAFPSPEDFRLAFLEGRAATLSVPGPTSRALRRDGLGAAVGAASSAAAALILLVVV